MSMTTNCRLHEALSLLGYESAKQLHYRSNLINAIQQFAGLHHDAVLEAACEAELDRIRAEIAAAQAGKMAN